MCIRDRGAVQRLTLSLHLEAEHHRPSRWIHIQTNDVDELLLKVRVVRQLEVVHPPGFEVVIGPDPGDGVLSDPEAFGQRAGSPVRRGVIGGLMAGDAYDLGHRPLRQGGFATSSVRDHPDAVGTLVGEPRPPPTHRVRVHLAPASDLLVGQALGSPQQGLRLHHLAVRQRRGRSHLLQLGPLCLGHRQRRCGHHWHGQRLPHYFADRALGVRCRQAGTRAQQQFERGYWQRRAEVVALYLVTLMASQVCQLGAVSTPSAITSRLRLWPIRMIAKAMAAASELWVTSRMKLRSILSLSIGNRRRYARPEYPVPKSSMEICTPAAFRFCKVEIVRSVLVIINVSVSSSSSNRAGTS